MNEVLKTLSEIAIYQDTGKFPCDYNEQDKKSFCETFKDLEYIGEERAKKIIFYQVPVIKKF